MTPRHFQKILFMIMVAAFFQGCSIFQSKESKVRNQVQLFENYLNESDWKGARSLTSKDFVWFTKKDELMPLDSEDSTHRKNFITSFRLLMKDKNIKFQINKIQRSKNVSFTTYLTVRLYKDKDLDLRWRIRLQWTLINQIWIITEAKDLTRKKNSPQGSILQEFQEFTDYSTGGAPTRALKKARKKVDDITKKHNKRLMDAMKFEE